MSEYDRVFDEGELRAFREELRRRKRRHKLIAALCAVPATPLLIMAELELLDGSPWEGPAFAVMVACVAVFLVSACVTRCPSCHRSVAVFGERCSKEEEARQTRRSLPP